MNTEPTSHSLFTKITGHVRSIDGAMLQGAKVTCNNMETRTLADGFFVLHNVPLGKHKLTVSLQGFKPASKVVTVKEGEEAIQDFWLSHATGSAEISGHVYDAESKKTIEQGGTVILVLPVANKYKHIDRNGFYKFENLPAGKYYLSTSIEGYEDSQEVLTVAEGEKKVHDFMCRAKQVVEPSWG